jgi:hypothetical protein
MRNNSKGCSVSGCSLKHSARSLCAKHYKQLPEQKQYMQAYRRTAQNKAYMKSYLRNYAKTDKYRAYIKARASLPWIRARKAQLQRARVVDRIKESKNTKARIRTPRYVYNRAKITAKLRKLDWTINFTEFVALHSSVCHYCGYPLPETGSGLDRTDNAKGYSSNNVVPCCTTCNRTRGNRFSFEEMLTLGPIIKRIKDSRIPLVVNNLIQEFSTPNQSSVT